MLTFNGPEVADTRAYVSSDHLGVRIIDQDRPRTTGEIAGVARGDESRAAMGRAGKASRSPPAAGAGL